MSHTKEIKWFMDIIYLHPDLIFLKPFYFDT